MTAPFDKPKSIRYNTNITPNHGATMLYQGCFIARIPNDEHAQSKIDKFKEQHGQLRLHGSHKDRKGAMRAVGRRLNSNGDLPWRLGTEIVIYRGESGMTFKQFQSLQIGDLVSPYHWNTQMNKGKVAIVVDKKGKNKLKVAYNGWTEWTTRQQYILFNREEQ